MGMAVLENNIIIKQSDIHGKGVFTTKNFKLGDTVVINHVITFPIDNKYPDKLIRFCYKWKDNLVCIFAGEGVFINSSKTPNVIVELDYEKEIARFKAIKNINEDEELFYNYEY